MKTVTSLLTTSSAPRAAGAASTRAGCRARGPRGGPCPGRCAPSRRRQRRTRETRRSCTSVSHVFVRPFAPPGSCASHHRLPTKPAGRLAPGIAGALPPRAQPDLLRGPAEVQHKGKVRDPRRRRAARAVPDRLAVVPLRFLFLWYIGFPLVFLLFLRVLLYLFLFFSLCPGTCSAAPRRSRRPCARARCAGLARSRSAAASASARPRATPPPPGAPGRSRTRRARRSPRRGAPKGHLLFLSWIHYFSPSTTQTMR